MAIGHNVGPNPAAITPLGGLYAPVNAPGPVVQPVPQNDDPPLWKTYGKYQGGALDLAVNVALLALVLPLVRAPLYVTAPTSKPATQIEHTVNVAALAPPSASPVPAAAEPTYFKRLPPQMDVLPNLAAFSTASPINQAEPAFYPRAKAQLDFAPNIAVGKQTAITWGGPEPVTWRGKWLAPDLPTNVAIRVTTTAPISDLTDPTFYPKSNRQPDLYPNLAVRVLPPGNPAFPAPEPTFTKAVPAAPDLYPNLAIATQAPPARIPAPVEPTLTAGRWAQPDLPANIAIRVPLVVAPLNATPEPVYAKRAAPQIDIVRNLAIYAPPEGKPVTPPLDLPVKAKIGPIPDIFPNLAVYFTAPASAQLVMPNVVGLLIWEAINVLIQNGNIIPIGAPSSLALGYFTPYPVSVKWLISSLPINTVFAQSIAAGTVVIPNAPITLSVSRTPFGASWPGG